MTTDLLNELRTLKTEREQCLRRVTEIDVLLEGLRKLLGMELPRREPPRQRTWSADCQTVDQVVAALRIKQPQTVAMLREVIGVTTLGYHLPRMVETGLIVREQDETSRRHWYALDPTVFQVPGFKAEQNVEDGAVAPPG